MSPSLDAVAIATRFFVTFFRRYSRQIKFSNQKQWRNNIASKSRESKIIISASDSSVYMKAEKRNIREKCGDRGDIRFRAVSCRELNHAAKIRTWKIIKISDEIRGFFSRVIKFLFHLES